MSLDLDVACMSPLSPTTTTRRPCFSSSPSNIGSGVFVAVDICGGMWRVDADNGIAEKIKLKDTYEMLLICWPEIQEMINAKQRMEDLWNWLKPFSYARFIEIEDLDQLVSLARPIKLDRKSVM